MELLAQPEASDLLRLFARTSGSVIPARATADSNYYAIVLRPVIQNVFWTLCLYSMSVLRPCPKPVLRCGVGRSWMELTSWRGSTAKWAWWSWTVNGCCKWRLIQLSAHALALRYLGVRDYFYGALARKLQCLLPFISDSNK